MAKGAASEAALGRLHAKLADVFLKILERYEAGLQTTVTSEQITDDMLAAVLEDTMPEPAMLNAVTAFLKNNEIRFDTSQVQKIDALKQSLEERRGRRANVVELRNVKAVGDD